MSHSISSLPTELLADIFSYCGARDQGAIAQVCTAWLRAVSSPVARGPLLRRVYGVTDLSEMGATISPARPQIQWRAVPDRAPLPFRTDRSVCPGLFNGRPVIAGVVEDGIAVYDSDSLERLAFLPDDENQYDLCSCVAEGSGQILLWDTSASQPVLWDIDDDSLERLPPLAAESNVMGVVSWRGVPSLFYDKEFLYGAALRPLAGGDETSVDMAHKVMGDFLIGSVCIAGVDLSSHHNKIFLYEASKGIGPREFSVPGMIVDYAALGDGAEAVLAIVLLPPEHDMEEGPAYLELRSLESGELIERLATDLATGHHLSVATEDGVSYLHAVLQSRSVTSVRTWHVIGDRARAISSCTKPHEGDQPPPPRRLLLQTGFQPLNRLLLPGETGWQAFEPVALPATTGMSLPSDDESAPSSTELTSSSEDTGLETTDLGESTKLQSTALRAPKRHTSHRSLLVFASVISAVALGIIGWRAFKPAR